MKVYIVTNLIGSFALDENNNILEYKIFPKDFDVVVEKFLKINEILDEERALIENLSSKGFEEFVFSIRKNVEDKRIKYEPDNKAEKYIRKNLRKLVKEIGIFKTDEEFNSFLTMVGVELARRMIKSSVGRDTLVIQAINALDEIDKSINIYTERLREWYGLHFPEMDRFIKDHEKFAKIVVDFGFKENIKKEKLVELAKRSAGIDLTPEDLSIIQNLGQEVLNLFKLRRNVEKYIDNTLKEIAPNLREVAGPTIAAKLISIAGGIEKLAKMPSSTIQLLGAEKALFRYLHGKGKPPRHGIIFIHPLIQKSPNKYRGKIARLLASKLSIAAKVDFYKGEFIGKKLKRDVEEKVKEILSG